MAGNCPKCEKPVARPKLVACTIAGGGHSWHGCQYLCPYCSTILGVQIDPIAIRTDLLDGVKKLLGR